jgi:hypothetical protein
MWYPDLIAVSTVVAATAAVAVTFRWFRHRERLATLAAQHAPPDGVEARLRRIEAQLERVTGTMDAIAVEMERVGEGQRFLAARLVERPPAPPAHQLHGRIVTPH